MSGHIAPEDLFDTPIAYPDVLPRERFRGLIGIDEQKAKLQKTLGVFVNPRGLQQWARTHHPDAEQLITAISRRPPLVVLAGDVGCGKTELAETIGDAVARQQEIDITLYPLSLNTRGQGRVGEMTRLLTSAFHFVVSQAAKLKSEKSGHARGAVLLLVDEADALAQSREESQMHHEDRAGVNAFIRGVDRITNEAVPAAVLMCTNRLTALDPAVRRRSAEILTFERPNPIQRREFLGPAVEALGLSRADLEFLVDLTGPQEKCEYGFTFSDLRQRLLPALILDAYPDQPVSAERVREITHKIIPTPPFRDGGQ
jgi:AAA+ superfamily predicted ATPase